MGVITEQDEDSPRNPKILLNFKTLKKISTMLLEGDENHKIESHSNREYLNANGMLERYKLSLRKKSSNKLTKSASHSPTSSVSRVRNRLGSIRYKSNSQLLSPNLSQF